ncbi:hypothetical protein K438DRAFT_1767429 [Mycena galopus ATCC 62051]|nr:hypothetical protein K438DRAFT_1767429 [Mycena galopus ATCC 62051]
MTVAIHMESVRSVAGAVHTIFNSSSTLFGGTTSFESKGNEGCASYSEVSLRLSRSEKEGVESSALARLERLLTKDAWERKKRGIRTDGCSDGGAPRMINDQEWIIRTTGGKRKERRIATDLGQLTFRGDVTAASAASRVEIKILQGENTGSFTWLRERDGALSPSSSSDEIRT